MKALSVKQPWAFLLSCGAKTIEVRSWGTAHRGELLICASAAPKNFFWYDEEDDFNHLLHAGCMIAVVDLIDIRKMTRADEEASMCDFIKGAYAWVVEPVDFVRPDKILGKLKLFDVPDSAIIRLNNDNEWIFDYPTPQGNIQYDANKHDRWA